MIFAELGLKFDNFSKGLDQAKGQLQKFASQATAFGGPIANLFGGASAGLGMLGKFSGPGAALAGIAAIATTTTVAFKGMFEVMAGATEKINQSLNVGTSISNLYRLEKAFNASGVGAENVETVMGKLRGKVGDLGSGTPAAVAAFAKLGISFGEIKGKDMADVLGLIGARLAKLGPDAKAAAISGIFGERGGFRMGSFFERGGLDALAPTASTKAKIMEEYAGLFEDITRKQKEVFGSQKEGFFLGMAAEFAPLIQPVLKGLTKTDAAAAGKSVGASFITSLGNVFGGPLGGFGINWLKEKFGAKPEDFKVPGTEGAQAGENKPLPIMAGIADSLARIGGGGNVFGDQYVSGQTNPILDENRRQTSVLEEIRNSINKTGIIATGPMAPMTLA
jgi:hypothetical protein